MSRKDFWQKMPLSHTAENGRLETIKFLVEEGGADVESKDWRGQTTLDLARGIQKGARPWRRGWRKKHTGNPAVEGGGWRDRDQQGRRKP